MFDLLKGVKVIDLTTVVLGPYATQVLGDFGADVVKVESLDGDVFRAVRPGRSPGMGAGYLNCNRNKRSIAIDLKHAEGHALLRASARDTDGGAHNMRPGTADRSGLGYCYAPGFGQNNPLAGAPAYDDIMRARSGIAHLNGGADGAPRYLPSSFATRSVACIWRW